MAFWGNSDKLVEYIIKFILARFYKKKKFLKRQNLDYRIVVVTNQKLIKLGLIAVYLFWSSLILMHLGNFGKLRYNFMTI